MACFWQVNCTWQMSLYAAAPCNDLCTQPNSSLISKTFHYQSVGPSSQHCWFLSAQQKCCLSQELPVGDCLARENLALNKTHQLRRHLRHLQSHFLNVTHCSLFWEGNSVPCKRIIFIIYPSLFVPTSPTLHLRETSEQHPDNYFSLWRVSTKSEIFWNEWRAWE